MELNPERLDVMYRELNRVTKSERCLRFAATLDSSIKTAGRHTWWTEFLKNEKKTVLNNRLKTRYLDVSKPAQGSLIENVG